MIRKCLTILPTGFQLEVHTQMTIKFNNRKSDEFRGSERYSSNHFTGSGSVSATKMRPATRSATNQRKAMAASANQQQAASASVSQVFRDVTVVQSKF